jgi:hypothetical protein
MLKDDLPYCDHLEPAVLQATLKHVQDTAFAGRKPKYYLYNGGRGGQFSLVAQQQPRPSLVPWELAAGPAPCSDCRRVSLEPAVQLRTEMLQKSALKICLMPRNLGRPHTPLKGARAFKPACLSGQARAVNYL